jgi:hypothetical protein
MIITKCKTFAMRVNCFAIINFNLLNVLIY